MVYNVWFRGGPNFPFCFGDDVIIHAICSYWAFKLAYFV